ncbi:MAG: CvpA family protein [Amoebophilaceae bacterium]|nr:CvpA family protein [Amoebophilaceae bacterium]
MKLVDTLLLLLLLWGGYSGFRKGLIAEVFSVSALVLAVLGSTRLLNAAVLFCAKWYQDQDELLPYVTFVLLFTVIFMTIMWTGNLLKTLIKPTLLGSLDKLLGGVVGILKWGICSSTLLWLGHLVQLHIPEVYTEGTFFFPIVELLCPRLLAWGTSWIPWIQGWLTATDTIQHH